MESLEFPGPGSTVPEKLTSAGIEALERLRRWHETTAKEMGLPDYAVFLDNALIAIAARMPATLDELALIRDVSKHKIEKYGQDVLKALATDD
jgi:ATP-dependent DNA helicase RecQ